MRLHMFHSRNHTPSALDGLSLESTSILLLSSLSVVAVKRPSANVTSSSPADQSLLSLAYSSSALWSKSSGLPKLGRNGRKTKATSEESEVNLSADAFTHFKHLLLPITDMNPYLSEGTRQAAATVTGLARKYGAEITVFVIDEKQKEALPQHETQMARIRLHLYEGGFLEFKLLE